MVSAPVSRAWLRRMTIPRPTRMVVMAGIMAFALLTLPVLSHAPNRLLSGKAIAVWQLPEISVAALLGPVVMLAVLGAVLGAIRGRWGLWVGGLTAVLWPVLYLAVAGAEAARLATLASPLARTSIASAGWLVMVLAWLTASEAVRQLRLSPPLVLGWLCIPVIALAWLASTGGLEALSIIKEWAAKHEAFAAALAQHGVIVAWVVFPTVGLGIGLGALLFHTKRWQAGILSALAIIQTIPSIALFGLLMAPLAALGQHVPWLPAHGIRGIGLAPAVLALTAYGLLPMVRNTLAGLQAVPLACVEAAIGLGMTPAQVFWQVRWPLALPVLLVGGRVMVVQTIGLAAVAALIGAGGLGSLMFQGLFANAVDLILLGALPVMALAVLTDVVLRVITAILERDRP